MDVDTNQPLGTPTWIDLGVPDLDRALAFYGAVFGWDFDVGPEEYGRYTTCLLRGRRVAGMSAEQRPGGRGVLERLPGDRRLRRTAERAREAGGTLLTEPMDVMDLGRMALVRDPVGAQFALWQGRAHTGAQVVNEPGSLVRNDLVTADPEPARAVLRRGLRLHARPQRGHAGLRLHLPAPTRRPRGRRHHGRCPAQPRPGPRRSRSRAPTRSCGGRSRPAAPAPAAPRSSSTAGWPRSPIRSAREFTVITRPET